VSRIESGGQSGRPTRARSRELRAWIDRYLRLGFSVIPIRYLEKAPPLVGWEEFQHRQPTGADVEDWFRRFKTFNVAVVTGRVSRLLVIDFDDYDVYLDWLDSLPLRYRLVVHNFTIKVKTPRGAHVYIRPENPEPYPRARRTTAWVLTSRARAATWWPHHRLYDRVTGTGSWTRTRSR